MRSRWLALLEDTATDSELLREAADAAREGLDPERMRAAQQRADRRILPHPLAADVEAALERGFDGRTETRTYEMTSEEIVEALSVPSNQAEFLPELADPELRAAVIRELMRDVLSEMRAGTGGNGRRPQPALDAGRVLEAGLDLTADGPVPGAVAPLQHHRDDCLCPVRVADRVAAGALRRRPSRWTHELEGAAVRCRRRRSRSGCRRTRTPRSGAQRFSLRVTRRSDPRVAAEVRAVRVSSLAVAADAGADAARGGAGLRGRRSRPIAITASAAMATGHRRCLICQQSRSRSFTFRSCCFRG